MTSSLGTGPVQYHEDRPIIHFASPQADIDEAIRRSRMRASGFDVARDMREVER